VDIHSPTGPTTDYRHREARPGKSYTIPYRILLPREIDNLLVAGRCVSATHEALSAIRVMPICMVMGQAAGTAAAMCLRNGCGPKELDLSALQAQLISDGVWLGERFGQTAPKSASPS
jgi:hypothetical protein